MCKAAAVAGKELCGKVALITGASGQIGACTAVKMAQAGACVFITDRDECGLCATAKAVCEQACAEATMIPADLTDDCHPPCVINTTLCKAKRLDILVNAAAMWTSGGICNTCLENYDCVMDINIRGMWHLTWLAVPYIMKCRGTIINVAGVFGMRPFNNTLNYCISKAAVIAFTQCAALDLAPAGVRVNCVSPGITRTLHYCKGGMQECEQKCMFERACKNTPMARVGTPDDVSEAILYLAGPKLAHSTGVNLPVDGGWNLVTPFSF